MLADGAALARQLSAGQVRVDVTHALVAALRTGCRSARVPGIERPWDGAERLLRPAGEHGPSLSGVADHLRSEGRTRTARERGAAAIPRGRPATSPSWSVADAPAEGLDDDRLGMATDARALAEVVCLRKPGPPLAIGLFGDWGSGKSTFMNLIEAAIEELTERTRKDATARAALVSKVIHIRFNAWHYNDDNLWASLTSEFFGQLRAGGHGKSATSTYEALAARGAEAR